MLQIFTVGLALGFYAAAIPGPINLEVIRRSISRGPRIGLTFGLGASLADVLFTLLSSLGALAIVNSLPIWGKGIMWLSGSLVLFVLGIQGLRAKFPVGTPSTGTTGKNPTLQEWEPFPKVTVKDMIGSFLLGLALTLSSPPTIMFWIFTGLTVAGTHLTRGNDNVYVPYMLAAGVAVACSIWVSGAVTVAGRFHRNLRPQTYLWVERVAGVVMCGFACKLLFDAVKILLAYRSPV